MSLWEVNPVKRYSETRVCLECGTEFLARHKNHYYCSTQCGAKVRHRRYERNSRDRDEAQKGKEFRERMKKEGRCVRCGGLRDIPERLTCTECLRKLELNR